MEHLAILKKQWLGKILSGEKTIESRWYRHRKTPYNNIAKGDIVYLKESGKPVTAKAAVKNVLFFDNLDRNKIKEILQRYGKQIGVTESYADELTGKNYCSLIFLEDVQETEPFDVNKKGYGMMAAWISVESIDELKL